MKYKPEGQAAFIDIDVCNLTSLVTIQEMLSDEINKRRELRAEVRRKIVAIRALPVSGSEGDV